MLRTMLTCKTIFLEKGKEKRGK